MADFSIPFTVPDSKVDDLLEALGDRYGMALTPAQLREQLKQEVIDKILRPAYLDWKRKLADINDLGLT